MHPIHCLRALSISLSCALLAAGPVCATTFRVTNALESGSGSLRAAIESGNAVPQGTDVLVQFDPDSFTTPKTVQLTASSLPLTLTRSMEIEGPPLLDGRPAVTISGDVNGDGIAGEGDKPAFVTSGSTPSEQITVRNLAVEHCYSANAFGAALSFKPALAGVLLLEDCVFRGNASLAAGAFVAAGAAHAVTLRRCTFADNRALVTSGGAIYLSSPVLATLERCTFSNNEADSYGGALYSNAGSLVIKDCLFHHNKSGFGGGAIEAHGQLACEGCTFSENQTDAQGGAVYIQVVSPAAMAGIENCTFTRNYSTGWGSAICSFDATFFLRHCTVVENTSALVSDLPAAVALTSNSSASVTNCLVAGNLKAGSTVEAASFYLRSSTLSSASGGNLIGNADSVPGVFINPTDQTGTAAAPLAAGVGPLQNNGGFTPTRAPLKGSLAINAGVASALATDQRGLARPSGSAPDAGAVEFKQLNFNQWVALYFTGPGDGQMNDPDGDGLRNLAEYYLGTDPTTPTPTVTTGDMTGGRLRMTWPVADHVLPNLFTATFETSQNLSSWNPASPEPVEVGREGNTIRYEATFAAGVPKRFARLVVVPAP